MSEGWKNFLTKRDRRRGVTNFAVSGVSCPVIYAVTVVDHPQIVKVGRSMKWSRRRKAYADWNLRKGDGILRELAFEINEEYVDLEMIERECLSLFSAHLEHGLEWFKVDFDDAVMQIREYLAACDVAFTEVE